VVGGEENGEDDGFFFYTPLSSPSLFLPPSPSFSSCVYLFVTQSPFNSSSCYKVTCLSLSQTHTHDLNACFSSSSSSSSFFFFFFHFDYMDYMILCLSYFDSFCVLCFSLIHNIEYYNTHSLHAPLLFSARWVWNGFVFFGVFDDFWLFN
jgi:hypothetical protein